MYVKALLPTSETLNRESSLFKNMEAPIMPLAKASPFDYPCTWEWLGPGGLPGLQNLWRVALRAAVGSTPIHSRLILTVDDGPSTIVSGPSFFYIGESCLFLK